MLFGYCFSQSDYANLLISLSFGNTLKNYIDSEALIEVVNLPYTLSYVSFSDCLSVVVNIDSVLLEFQLSHDREVIGRVVQCSVSSGVFCPYGLE